MPLRTISVSFDDFSLHLYSLHHVFLCDKHLTIYRVRFPADVHLEKNGVNVNGVSSTPTKIAPCADDNNDAVKPRIRVGKSRRSNKLAQSWHPMSHTSSTRKDRLQAEHPKEEKIKERSILKKQASSILGKRRPSSSRHSLRLGNELDPAQIDQLQIIDEKTDPFLKNLHWWHAVFFFGTISLLACLLQVLLPPPYGLILLRCYC